MTTKIDSSKYVMPFGKYKGIKLTDPINLKTVDKNGEDKETGKLYLQWLVTNEWFKNADVIQEVLDGKCNKKEGKSFKFSTFQ